MYRGPSSKGRLQNIADEMDRYLEPTGTITVSEVQLSGAALKDGFKVKAKVELPSICRTVKLQLKRKPFVWSIPDGTIPLEFNDNPSIEICFKRKYGIDYLFASHKWFSPIFEPMPYAKQILSDGGRKKLNNAEFHMVMDPLEDITVDLLCRVGPCGVNGAFFKLIPGEFNSISIPEDDSNFWGPVVLPKLLPGIPNMCNFATHR